MNSINFEGVLFCIAHLCLVPCVHGLPLSLQEPPQTHSPLTDLESGTTKLNTRILNTELFYFLLLNPQRKLNISELS